jgi:rhodanese-related sulfurtransferase
MSNQITRDELATAITTLTPPVLLEALGEPYFRKGHLPGARRIDYLNAIEQVQALGVARDAAIVVYCASTTCPNSHIAAEALRGAGFGDVRVYAGGKADWQEAGLALSREAA